MKKLIPLFFLLTIFSNAQTIQLSPQAEISVITCGPGHGELYATFGHSALRVQDITNKLDRVYNYGTFNFNAPNFYLNFVRGKLLYELRAYNFGSFLQSYYRENRWVKGQVLDLDKYEVQQVFNFLENNAKPENRSYQYDFFYDNCSTKIYDVLEVVLKDKLIFDNHFETENYTHRELIQLYLGNHPWGDFGIDLALGSTIDKQASKKEYMFLPDFVFKSFSKINRTDQNIKKPFVKRTEGILESKEALQDNPFLTPMVVFSLLAILIITLTIIDYKRKDRNRILDFSIFLITGLIGIVILLLWFATDHRTTVDNYNIFWGFAPNIILAFYVLNKKSKKNIKNYIIFLLILLDITVLIWIFKIQIYSIALIPILVALYTRYIYLWFYYGKINTGKYLN